MYQSLPLSSCRSFHKFVGLGVSCVRSVPACDRVTGTWTPFLFSAWCFFIFVCCDALASPCFREFRTFPCLSYAFLAVAGSFHSISYWFLPSLNFCCLMVFGGTSALAVLCILCLAIMVGWLAQTDDSLSCLLRGLGSCFWCLPFFPGFILFLFRARFLILGLCRPRSLRRERSSQPSLGCLSFVNRH